MIIVQNILKYDKQKDTALTIGTFDGVHIGHRMILNRLISHTKDTELKSTLLTFFPHPRIVLQKDSDIKLLTTIDEKTKILESLGLDILIVHPFTKEFSRLSAIEFVRDLLVNKLQAKKIVIGYDHRFGRNRNANINDLIGYGTTFGFEVDEIPAQEIDEISVSSTKIRRALEDGDVATANSYLGYPYMLTGIVTKGKGIGRQLNFPTANLFIEESYKLIPKNGVYIVNATINNKVVSGMMNIGYNPTVNGLQNQPGGRQGKIEVHFFNFNQDLYDQTIQVNILHRIRDEHKFDSVEALKKQLEKDRETSISFLSD
ncbi:bifunctional riboflavin kinase/FAD synthetase [Aurantibacter crassamenti]|uniref:bifunctional riboflavin kinase/FAD synthetase n=1 Tax=Aurantibacter crassamenti TaxID=1837375 RepID=UPI0019397FE1|nr:bifunctional riboflavin kinase/FAD synthetase [Aurantibacter crassamenti]MBM1105578.1 bifunctional riboflavin kinase/FAD synthetase [Aurantibacter crassamenti]